MKTAIRQEQRRRHDAAVGMLRVPDQSLAPAWGQSAYSGHKQHDHLTRASIASRVPRDAEPSCSGEANELELNPEGWRQLASDLLGIRAIDENTEGLDRPIVCA